MRVKYEVLLSQGHSSLLESSDCFKTERGAVKYLEAAVLLWGRWGQVVKKRLAPGDEVRWIDDGIVCERHPS